MKNWLLFLGIAVAVLLLMLCVGWGCAQLPKRGEVWEAVANAELFFVLVIAFLPFHSLLLYLAMVLYFGYRDIAYWKRWSASDCRWLLALRQAALAALGWHLLSWGSFCLKWENGMRLWLVSVPVLLLLHAACGIAQGIVHATEGSRTASQQE